MKIDWESFWLFIVGLLLSMGGITLDAVYKEFSQGGFHVLGILFGTFIMFLALKNADENSYGYPSKG